MKKQQEEKELSVSELQVKLKQAHEEQMNMRLKMAINGQVAKPHQIKGNRRAIARLETYLRMKRGN